MSSSRAKWLKSETDEGFLQQCSMRTCWFAGVCVWVCVGVCVCVCVCVCKNLTPGSAPETLFKNEVNLPKAHPPRNHYNTVFSQQEIYKTVKPYKWGVN